MADLSDDDLKRYGFAPGNYMSKCCRCGFVVCGLDKRATCCRPCAIEADRALNARAAEPVGPNAPWGDMRQWAINMAKAEADAGDPDMTAGCSACVTCGQPWSAQPAPVGAEGLPPSVEAAESMGAKGAPANDGERLAFEAWMRGHCWALCATWTGTEYRSDGEQGGWPDPQATATRRMWAAWRDRAALASRPVVDGGARFLLLAMDDDGTATPTFCADESAVEAALLPLMFFLRPGEALSDDHAAEFKDNLAELLDVGSLAFEGDPGILLFKLPKPRTAPTASTAPAAGEGERPFGASIPSGTSTHPGPIQMIESDSEGGETV